MTDGILLVDKPSGPTSHDMVREVRRSFGMKRVGHAGTLDPLATGLLPMLLGRATPLLRFLPSEPKKYRVVARFGITTATGDACGPPEEVADPGRRVPVEWDAVAARHEGALELSVPRYAAVKVDGQPLYKYSRQGIAVTPPRRTMTVHSLETDAAGWPWVEMTMTTAGGTYVRAVVESMGTACGCGAHVVSLRRLQVGAWSVADAASLVDIRDRTIPETAQLPLSKALALASLTVDETGGTNVAYGRPPQRVVHASQTKLTAGEAFVFTDSSGDVLAVARCEEAWQETEEPPSFHYERVLVAPS
jgi:tRNA pseudouridine55 synthase